MDTKMMNAVISATLNNAIDNYKNQSVEKALEVIEEMQAYGRSHRIEPMEVVE